MLKILDSSSFLKGKTWAGSCSCWRPDNVFLHWAAVACLCFNRDLDFCGRQTIRMDGKQFVFTAASTLQPLLQALLRWQTTLPRLQAERTLKSSQGSLPDKSHSYTRLDLSPQELSSLLSAPSVLLGFQVNNPSPAFQPTLAHRFCQSEIKPNLWAPVKKHLPLTMNQKPGEGFAFHL